MRKIQVMIIGREQEIQQLKRAYDSDEAELVVVYGRRRVGKTFLIRNVFDNRFAFYFTGAYNVTTKEQLANFHDAIKSQSGQSTPKPSTWTQAFNQLKAIVETSNEKKKVIFIDELPWLDAPRSGFVSALEYFWNSWGSARKDLLFIICGSASSWIIDKIFRNKGGLHNRVTSRIHLHPFTLHETEFYAAHRQLGYVRNQILEGYMVMGGVPFYWSKLQPGKSLARNINDIFISEYGELRYEFRELYSSIFNRPEKYIAIIEALSTKKKGLTREEIVKAAKIENNGHLSNMIEDLTECGFIRKYCHTDKKLKDAIYQIVDSYTLFYYRFVRNSHAMDEEYWMKIQQTPTYNTWCGLAFERVCLLHTRQIKATLGISGIIANVFSWHTKKNDNHPGVQIDLLIDRTDNVINICEMKYAPNGYILTKAEANKIKTRAAVFSLYAPKHKAIQSVLITSNGSTNASQALPQLREITADSLFIP